MSKCVYVVSPDYLQPLCEQAMDFSFDFKGYSSLKSAMSNLKFTNMSSILGVAIVFYELPPDLGELVDFINALNRSADGLPVVLVAQCSTVDGFNVILDAAQTNHLKFYSLYDFEDMLDVVIKQSIYGTIVLENFDPYLEKEPVPVTCDSPRTLFYKPIFPEDISSLAEPIVSAPDAQRAICNDSVAVYLHDNNPVVYLLRCLQVFLEYSEIGEAERACIAFKNYIKCVTHEKEKLLYVTVFKVLCRKGGLESYANDY